MFAYEEADIAAVCDIYQDRIDAALHAFEDSKLKFPAQYTDYKKLIDDKNVEAVVIISSWDMHTRMAVYSMKASKYTTVEVIGAYDIEDCWQLIRTYEDTKTPIMLLENCCFDRFELLSTSLVRN